MSSEKELKRFISGKEEIDFAKVLAEINKMTLISARRIGRVVSKYDADEISSCLFTWLWENKDKFPMEETEVFSKLKRFIYKSCSLTQEISGFDSSFDSVFEKKNTQTVESKEETSNSKQVFLENIESFALPQNIVEQYKKAVMETDTSDLYEMSSTDTFLGHLLLAFLIKKDGDVQNKAKNIFTLTTREEEVLLACFSLKLMKTWVITAYITFGQTLFVSLISFLLPVLGNTFEKYLKKLFHSVRIFCAVEKLLHDISLEEALRKLSKQHGIRMRNISKRYIKVQTMLEKFKGLSEIYTNQLQADMVSFYRREKDQLSFKFMQAGD